MEACNIQTEPRNAAGKESIMSENINKLNAEALEEVSGGKISVFRADARDHEKK